MVKKNVTYIHVNSKVNGKDKKQKVNEKFFFPPFFPPPIFFPPPPIFFPPHPFFFF
jgi:hypothetical protein